MNPPNISRPLMSIPHRALSIGSMVQPSPVGTSINDAGLTSSSILSAPHKRMAYKVEKLLGVVKEYDDSLAVEPAINAQIESGIIAMDRAVLSILGRCLDPTPVLGLAYRAGAAWGGLAMRMRLPFYGPGNKTKSRAAPKKWKSSVDFGQWSYWLPKAWSGEYVVGREGLFFPGPEEAARVLYQSWMSMHGHMEFFMELESMFGCTDAMLLSLDIIRVVAVHAFDEQHSNYRFLRQKALIHLSPEAAALYFPEESIYRPLGRLRSFEDSVGPLLEVLGSDRWRKHVLESLEANTSSFAGYANERPDVFEQLCSDKEVYLAPYLVRDLPPALVLNVAMCHSTGPLIKCVADALDGSIGLREACAVKGALALMCYTTRYTGTADSVLKSRGEAIIYMAGKLDPNLLSRVLGESTGEAVSSVSLALQLDMVYVGANGWPRRMQLVEWVLDGVLGVGGGVILGAPICSRDEFFMYLRLRRRRITQPVKTLPQVLEYCREAASCGLLRMFGDIEAEASGAYHALGPLLGGVLAAIGAWYGVPYSVMEELYISRPPSWRMYEIVYAVRNGRRPDA